MESESVIGRTIQIFLVDGTTAGLRKATIHGWTGQVFISGKPAFDTLLERDDVDEAGVYMLLGPDMNHSGKTRVYIDSGESVVEKIRKSAETRDFWNMAIAVTTSDDSLSERHARYLGARLGYMVKQAGRVILEGCTYSESDNSLSEADTANMEWFLSNLGMILPVIGLDLLIPEHCTVGRLNDDREFEIDHCTMDRLNDDQGFEIDHQDGAEAADVEKQEASAEDRKEPVDEQQEPVDGQQESVDGQEEPVKGQEEPVKGQEEPVKGQEEPVKGQEEPVKGQERFPEEAATVVEELSETPETPETLESSEQKASVEVSDEAHVEGVATVVAELPEQSKQSEQDTKDEIAPLIGDLQKLVQEIPSIDSPFDNDLSLVGVLTSPEPIVVLGSKVRIQFIPDGKEMTFVLVDLGENDPEHGKIGINTPLGDALLDMQIGDEVEYEVDSHFREVQILEIDGQTEKPVDVRTVDSVQFEILHQSGVRALAVENNGEFIILNGSEVFINSDHAEIRSHTGSKTRQALIDMGVLVPDGTDRLRFVKPWIAGSPSMAASVVLDCSSNGRRKWKVKDSGLTYGDWKKKTDEEEKSEKPDSDVPDNSGVPDNAGVSGISDVSSVSVENCIPDSSDGPVEVCVSDSSDDSDDSDVSNAPAEDCVSVEDCVPVENRVSDDVQFELRHKSGIQAAMMIEDGKFVVQKGSESLNDPGYTGKKNYSGSKIRDKLISDGILVSQGKNKLRFIRSWSFDSPSTAVSVVLNREGNGPRDWKVKGSSGLNYGKWKQGQA